MKILVCGQKEFGAAVLRQCRADGHEVVAACAPPFRSDGATPDRLADTARTFGIQVIPSGGLFSHTVPAGVDVIVAAHSHDFISGRVRSRAKYGAIGYHPSLLPRHRGRDAIEWALRFGDPIAGGTVYWLGETMDGGPIAAQDWCWVRRGDTAAALWRRDLFHLGLRLFRDVLADLPGYWVNKKPQDESLATFEPCLTPPPKFRPDAPGIPYYDVRELMGPP